MLPQGKPLSPNPLPASQGEGEGRFVATVSLNSMAVPRCGVPAPFRRGTRVGVEPAFPPAARGRGHRSAMSLPAARR